MAPAQPSPARRVKTRPGCQRYGAAPRCRSALQPPCAATDPLSFDTIRRISPQRGLLIFTEPRPRWHCLMAPRPRAASRKCTPDCGSAICRSGQYRLGVDSVSTRKVRGTTQTVLDYSDIPFRAVLRRRRGRPSARAARRPMRPADARSPMASHLLFTGSASPRLCTDPPGARDRIPQYRDGFETVERRRPDAAAAFIPNVPGSALRATAEPVTPTRVSCAPRTRGRSVARAGSGNSSHCADRAADSA